MFCLKCGAEIPVGSAVCPKCGASLSAPKVEISNSVPQRAPKSIGGFVCGLMGFLLDWIPVVGLALSIVGVVLCGKGKKEVLGNPRQYEGTGLLTAGQVLGIIGIVLSSIFLLIWIVWGLILGASVGFLSIYDDIFDLL